MIGWLEGLPTVSLIIVLFAGTFVLTAATPRSEKPDRTIWTFARTQHGRLRAERGARWDAAELALLRGLEHYGFRDAYRELHGWDHKNPTWEWPRWGGGYRLDHLVVSAEVRVERVEYLHDWRRELRLSDHSALLAEFDLN